MIKKFVVSIFCMLVITSGFSFGILAEQNNKIITSKSRISDIEIVSYKVSSDTDANIVPSSYLFDILDQQQIVDAGFAWTVSENGYYAQSFIPTLGWLTRVELKIFKIGNPVGLTISVRSTLTGPDLTSKYLSAVSIPTNITNRAWIEFDFPDIPVTPGSTYYIVWDPVGVPDSHNNSYWCVGTGNPYVNGLAWKNLGSVWEVHNSTLSPDPDFCFKTYGFPGGNIPPNKPSTPSGPITGNIGDNLRYESYISDANGDGMEVYFDWGDGTHTGWVGKLTNGTVGNYKTWNTSGTYQVRVKARDTPYLTESPWSDSLGVTISEEVNNPPNKPVTPSGDTSGKVNVSYTYESSTSDIDGNQVYYLFDWGDGTDSGWIGAYDSGGVCQESHIWTTKGSYSIKVKAKDTLGAESSWSDPLPIKMPYTFDRPMLKFLGWLFERFPHAFPILRHVLGY
jgi:hypothetical protein